MYTQIFMLHEACTFLQRDYYFFNALRIINKLYMTCDI